MAVTIHIVRLFRDSPRPLRPLRRRRRRRRASTPFWGRGPRNRRWLPWWSRRDLLYNRRRENSQGFLLCVGAPHRGLRFLIHISRNFDWNFLPRVVMGVLWYFFVKHRVMFSNHNRAFWKLSFINHGVRGVEKYIVW